MMGVGMVDGRMTVKKGLRMPWHSRWYGSVAGVCNITTLLLPEH